MNHIQQAQLVGTADALDMALILTLIEGIRDEDESDEGIAAHQLMERIKNGWFTDDDAKLFAMSAIESQNPEDALRDLAVALAFYEPEHPYVAAYGPEER